MLTDHEYEAAAMLLRCDVPAIKAVAKIESGGRSGFLTSGRPVILFEAHKFHKWTNGRFDASYPNLSVPSWDRTLYFGGEREWERLGAAMLLDDEAAAKSTSWGMFQILGENFKAAGFDSVQAFTAAMHRDDMDHLMAFCSFVISVKLDDELRNHDWPAFARGYNGTGYKLNKYDEKIAAEYAVLTGAKDHIYGYLRIGDDGSDVILLQETLNDNFDAKLKVDGSFGRATRIAVENAQQAKGLKVDGVVGPMTWAAII